MMDVNSVSSVSRNRDKRSFRNYRKIIDFTEKDKCQALLTVFKNEGNFDTSNVLFKDKKFVLYDKDNPTPDMKYIDYGMSILSKSIIAEYMQDIAGRVQLKRPLRVVIDAGAKALTSDKRGPGILENRGFGLVVGHPEATIVSLSDEHGVLDVPNAEAYAIGAVIQVIPNHICPCVNLYSHAYAARNGIVHAIWDVSARGQSQ